MIKKTWITAHEAAESFGWTILDSFNVFKSVPPKTASKRVCPFLESPIHRGGTLKEKKISIQDI